MTAPGNYDANDIASLHGLPAVKDAFDQRIEALADRKSVV